jgi:hypothetical protein
MPPRRIVRSFAPVAQARSIQTYQFARLPLTQPVTLHHQGVNAGLILTHLLPGAPK